MKSRESINISKHLQTRQLNDIVENRTAYSLQAAELNVYETHARAERVELRFGHPVLATMVRGKKVMHLNGTPSFDFLPGESVMLPSHELMCIDFPEATETNPTQCLALALSEEKIQSLTDILNEQHPLVDRPEGWRMRGENFYFTNDTAVNQLLNRLVYICTEGNQARDLFAELVLRELTIRLMQTQARHLLLSNSAQYANQNRLAYAVQYLREHLHEDLTVGTLAQKACMSEPHFYRCFKQEFGLTPIEFINRERIRLATELLSTTDRTVTDISYACGYNNVNYFLKVFRRQVGMPPSHYRQRHRSRTQAQQILLATTDYFSNGAY
ncbi:AraC family transcriptional regulator [Telluribacter sp. SYSU D00476]|uniref:AraC family transcriptional regulator n=1 Tax=Telluribacter sp. SYSU D00476 TaxID=2811430 RepID=UPI001FF148D2|nr:AraC family transcriptional regulator [Telluribacter sp. SYSU D00476]